MTPGDRMAPADYRASSPRSIALAGVSLFPGQAKMARGSGVMRSRRRSLANAAPAVLWRPLSCLLLRPSVPPAGANPGGRFFGKLCAICSTRSSRTSIASQAFFLPLVRADCPLPITRHCSSKRHSTSTRARKAQNIFSAKSKNLYIELKSLSQFRKSVRLKICCAILITIISKTAQG
jgi:hypothetical protein